LRDLRISVTDRCNFRCRYCMPKEVFGPDYPYLARSQILTFEEIARLARVFHRQGVRKIRLTGGEPLLRRELTKLITWLAELPEVELALTTNGALLPQMADALRAAGLDRVTVSLDSLDDRIFQRMNDVDFPVSRVLEGIEAAQRAGLTPIKINAVVHRGVNDHTLVDLARHFRGSGVVVRFIEYMDVGGTNGWKLEEVLPGEEIVRRIDAEIPLEPVDPAYRGEVADRWRYRDGSGEIGVITSVTRPFCGDCTRIRLSAEGKVFTCLFATTGTDFRGPLRAGATDDELAEKVRRLWQVRENRYSEERFETTVEDRSPGRGKVEMSYIGG
jgi:cyclic pyranopterin phosphate synthase